MAGIDSRNSKYSFEIRYQPAYKQGLNMFPSLAGNYPAYACGRQSEVSCYGGLAFAIRNAVANFANLVFGKFAVVVTFATREATFACRVPIVFFWCAQKQMVWVAASRIVALVTYVQAIWDGTVSQFVSDARSQMTSFGFISLTAQHELPIPARS